MGTVRDPDFWRRFSKAVHQDEEAQAERGQKPGIKHSYVSPSVRSSNPPSKSPTSQWPLQYDMATITTTPEPFSPSTIGDLKEPITPISVHMPTTHQHTRQPSSPIQTSNAIPNPTPRKPAPTHSFTSHRNASQMTLGFSGRPPSRFKFWTQISSDPSNRNSWLESQQKKKRQRTWMCWVFWLCFLGIVAGVVVCVLFLKAKHII